MMSRVNPKKICPNIQHTDRMTSIVVTAQWSGGLVPPGIHVDALWPMKPTQTLFQTKEPAFSLCRQHSMTVIPQAPLNQICIWGISRPGGRPKLSV